MLLCSLLTCSPGYLAVAGYKRDSKLGLNARISHPIPTDACIMLVEHTGFVISRVGRFSGQHRVGGQSTKGRHQG
jgi:hypothetical protein